MSLIWKSWWQIRVRNRKWGLIKTFKHTVVTSLQACLYSNKVTFLPRLMPWAHWLLLMLISDETLLNGQLLFSRGWPLNRGSTVVNSFLRCLIRYERGPLYWAYTNLRYVIYYLCGAYVYFFELIKERFPTGTPYYKTISHWWVKYIRFLFLRVA